MVAVGVAALGVGCNATPTSADIQVAMQNLTAEPVNMWLGHSEEVPPSSEVAPSEFRFYTANVVVQIDKFDTGALKDAYASEGASTPTLGQCVQIPELSGFCNFDDRMKVNVAAGGTVRQFEIDLSQEPHNYSPTLYVDWDGTTVRVRSPR